MRRTRHSAEYRPAGADELTTQQVLADQPKAAAIVEIAAEVLDPMSPC